MTARLRIESAGQGEGQRPPGYRVPRRDLPFVLLEWGDHGAWELQLEGRREMVVPAGRVLVVMPGHAHALRAIGPPFTTHFLLIRVEVDGAPALVDPELSGMLSAQQSAGIQDHAQHLQSAATTLNQAVAANAALHAMVQTLLALRTAEYPLPSIHGRMTEVLARIDANLGEKFTRADCARWAGLSPTRFHVVFQAELGVSPMIYVRTRRLRRAQELLAISDQPIHQVASQCGFPSAYHFSRLFHQSQGCTPSAYRASARSR
jgi:AraC-like DNA-binding protein